MRKLICYSFVVLFLSAISINAQKDSSKTAHKFDPDKDPFSDVKSAVEIASKENKRIILDVGGEWCIWCHRLDKFIDENEEIKTFLNNNYILIKVNFSPENKNEKFLSQFPKVQGYPHFFVLNSDGKFLHSQDTGKLEKDKSYSAELLLNFLKDWSAK